MSDVLTELAALLEQRKKSSSSDSYVASLHEKGLNKILEKIGEEGADELLQTKFAPLIEDRKYNAVAVVSLWKKSKE